ncbi:hypothetical protein LCGC14_2825960 [marine sediment metagenome]|uniref:Uncharacterized protein n=1 Tax=marine sediment metagenome TaxID=412755 RepID=A0A0F9B6M5_9ZZZZ
MTCNILNIEATQRELDILNIVRSRSDTTVREVYEEYGI